MRRNIAVIMALTLILTSFSAVFAAAPSDVTGTVYEDAVSVLVEKGIISGYPDGTFRPADTIKRAEACSVVVNAMGAEKSDLDAAKDAGFTDLGDYVWATSYINYAAENGVVSGVGNNRFNPSGDVTYNEFAAMLINALGYKASEIGSVWPDDYFNKAVELEIFKSLPEALGAVEDGEEPANRGDVALMANAVAEKIAEANKSDDTDADGKDDKDDSKDDEKKDGDSKDEGTTSSDRFADFTGRVYGIILDVSEVKNTNGKTVDELKVLVGRNTFYLITDGKVDVKDPSEYWNGLYGIRMSYGAVTAISENFSSLGAKNAKELTSGFTQVTDRNNSIVEAGGKTFTVVSDASIYVAEFKGNSIDGYKASNLSNIKEGDYIRAYDVADNDDVADVILIVKEADWSKF